MSVRDSESDASALEAGCREALFQLTQWVSKSLPGIFLHHGWDWEDSDDEARALRAEPGEMFVLSCIVYGTSTETSVWRDAKAQPGNDRALAAKSILRLGALRSE